jgi:hypothetical protein
MKKHFISALIVCTMMAPAAMAQSEEELAATLYDKIEKNAPKNGTGEIIEQALAGKQDDPCFNEMKPEIEAMIRRYSKVDAARDVAVAEYVKYFSGPELQAMIAFADLPIGQKWFATQPLIAAKAANVAMNHFQQNQFKISQEIMEVLDRYRGKRCDGGAAE